MSKDDVHLIHYTICADGSRYQPHLHRRRVVWDEEVPVEAVEVFVANTASHGWDVVNVGLRDHGCHCAVDVFGLELD